jgi:tetratricopeptide (TPR) repeat protein
LIHGRTGGNPFFIEEICHTLIEEGTIQIKDRQAFMSRSLKHLSLPDTVQAVIRARLDRLDPNSRESLRLASVIGREFARRILERISTSTEQLSQSLETLKVFELIQQIRVVPEAAYLFKHALTQEVTYETLLRQKRKELHGLVAQAIEELYQDRIEEQVNLLHHHFSLAKNWPKAVNYGRQAAKRAYRLSQFHEAASILMRAQECLLQLPKDRSRQETLIGLQLKMNWPLINLGDLDRALHICQEAESVARSLASPVYLGKVFHQYHMIYFFKNKYKKAEQYALQALEQLEDSEEDALILLLKLNLAAAYFSIAQWEKAAELYSEVIRTQEAKNIQTEYLEEQPYLPYTHSCTHLGYIKALQGCIEETKKLLQKGNAPALKQVANLQSRIWCAVWHSAFSTIVGEDHGALARVEEVLKVAEKTDSPILCFLGYAAKGNALMAAEEFESAQQVYEQALKAIEGTAHRRFLESVYYGLVQTTLALGDRSAAERYYEAGLPLVELNPEKEASRFDCLRGRLLAANSPPDFEQAGAFFEQSIKADETSGAVVPAAQTRYYLAQMLGRKGEVERAREMLIGLRNHFQSWSIPVWQQKCEQELETLPSLE